MEAVRPIDGWDGGAGWIAHPDETIRRASHVIRGDAGSWLVDPVDAPDLDAWLAEYEPVAGVLVVMDRHTRDADTIAARHGVAVHLPDQLADLGDDLSAPVAPIGAFIEDTGWTARPIIDRRWWREVALRSPDGETVVVPEAVGTSAQMVAPGERLGVHPVLRPWPPRAALSAFTPERLLVGHGAGIMTDADAVLRDALTGARRRAPAAYLSSLRLLF